MQFAIVQDRILAAQEYAALMNHGTDISDRTIPESEMSLKLVYGSLKPQVGINAEEALKETMDTLGCLYGTIQGKECIPSILVDIEFQESFVRGRAVDVPFSALIRTTLEVGMKKKSSIPMFILYQDISSATSLLNRLGVLCVYRQENRPKAEITESGWRDAIRPERPLQCARNCR